MTGKDALRSFITGEQKYLWSEGVELMEKSIEAKGNPPNIATDVRLLKELLRGYRWALDRGFVGER